MKVKEISISKGFKVSLGYQVIQGSVAITIEVEEGEDPNTAYEQAKAWVSEKIREEIKKAVKSTRQIKDFVEAESLR